MLPGTEPKTPDSTEMLTIRMISLEKDDNDDDISEGRDREKIISARIASGACTMLTRSMFGKIYFGFFSPKYITGKLLQVDLPFL